MFVGTPVVGSNSGGVPEIIEDEVSGLLYKPGDHQMLASQITRLVQDPELYESISRM